MAPLVSGITGLSALNPSLAALMATNPGTHSCRGEAAVQCAAVMVLRLSCCAVAGVRCPCLHPLDLECSCLFCVAVLQALRAS